MLCLYVKSSGDLPNLNSTLMEMILRDSRLKVVILEELTEMENAMSEILNLLDGVKVMSGVVFVATTNYPKKLPQNIVNRPSRFDVIVEVGYLNTNQIRQAFEFYKCDPCDELIRKLEDEDMTFSHIKEICLKSKLINSSLLEAYLEIKKQLDLVQNNFKENGNQVGF